MSGQHSAWNAIMQYSFIKVFATDGVIDEAELAMLKRLALDDGHVDEQERAVLSRVFARVDTADLEPAVRDQIALFKAAFSIP